MRKTSLDGGDVASITSGDIENKKPGILKTKRSSIKRKVHNFSLESDDAVIEPLLQKDKESTEVVKQSAKHMLSKTNTDSIIEKGDDKDKLLADKKSGTPSMTSVPGVTDNAHLANGLNSIKDSIKSNGTTIAPLHNHMNTNVFSKQDALKGVSAPKTQILVEIETTKQAGYSPSPLIFTTAKIHIDGKSKQMEPVQVTPVPILSTIEGNVIKTGTVTDYSKGVRKESSDNADKQNMNDMNIVSRCQTNSVQFPGITSKVSSALVTKENYLNKIIITSSTLNQVSQVPITIDVKATKVTSVPLTSANIIHNSLLQNEQSVKTSPTSIQKLPNTTTINNRDSKIVTEEKTPLTNKTDEINRTDNAIKVIEMDINKNIQNTESITSPKPGTSNQVDSFSIIKTSDGPGKERISRQASSSFSNKNLQRQKNENVESSLEPDSMQVNSNKTEKALSSIINSESNLTLNKSISSNLISDLCESTNKTISPSFTVAISSVVTPISSSLSSQAQTIVTMSKSTTIENNSAVPLVEPLTSNSHVATKGSSMKNTTTGMNSNVTNIFKTQPVASTHSTSSVASAVSKASIISTAKIPVVNTTSQSSITENESTVSIAKPLISSAPVPAEDLSVKMMTTGTYPNNVINTVKTTVASTYSNSFVASTVSKPSTVSTVKTPAVNSTSQPSITVKDSKISVGKPLITSAPVPSVDLSAIMKTTGGSKASTVSTAKNLAANTMTQSSATVKGTKISVAKPLTAVVPVTVVASSSKMTTTAGNTNVTNTINSQSVASTKSTSSALSTLSKPSKVSTAKTPVITSQSSNTAPQLSSKSTSTGIKSTTAPTASHTSTAKTVADNASTSTASKPSTVTTMKSSMGQKVNTSAGTKPVTVKSAAPVVSTSTNTKISNKQTEHTKAKANAHSKDGKGSKA